MMEFPVQIPLNGQTDGVNSSRRRKIIGNELGAEAASSSFNIEKKRLVRAIV